MQTFLLVSIFSFVIYLLGLSNSVFGGDSGDIILASWFGGVAHPPGYPLNTMIGYFFTHLPFSATVAFKSNLMMSVLQSINVGILYLILSLLTKNRIISATAALFIAFNPLFWLYAHVTEVFQLKITLNSLAVYFLLLWRAKVMSKKPDKLKADIKYLYLSIVFLGLSIFYHHISLLLVPAFYYLIFRTKKPLVTEVKYLIRLSLGLFVGLIPYLFIVYAAFQKTPVNWDDPSNLHGFLRLITRADFGTFTAADFLVGQTVSDRFIQIKSLFTFLINDFGFVGLGLITLGLYYLFKKNRVLLYFTSILLILPGPFFLTYAAFPLSNDFLLGIWERFILEFYFFLAIPLSFGLIFLFQLLSVLAKKLKIKTNIILILFFVQLSFLLLPFATLLLNFSKTDLSNDDLGDAIGHDVLASSSFESIIIVLGDTIGFNSQYIYYTTDNFKDRKIMIGGLMKHPYYRKQIVQQYPELHYSYYFYSDYSLESASIIEDLIKSNRGFFPIYTSGMTVELSGAKWVPSGLLISLEDEDAKDIGIAEVFKELKYEDNLDSYRHFLSEHILTIYQEKLINTANYLAKNSNLDSARPFYEKAVNLFSDNADSYADFTRSLINYGECSDANKYLSASLNIERTLKLLENLSIYERECNNDEEAAKKVETEIKIRFGGEEII